jgi:hypothetical protein
MHMKSVFVAIIFVLSSCASTNVRQPSSASYDQSYQQDIKRLLPEGKYNGVVPGTTDGCFVQVNYGMNFNISASRADFQADRDRGSQACMYSQSCFSVVGDPEVVDSDISENHLKVRIRSDLGAERFSGTSTMGVEIQKNGDSTVVTLDESVGLFHMGTNSVACEFRR